MKKKCKQCEYNLPRSRYHKDKILKDGYRNICKDCACARAKRSRIDKIKDTDGLYTVLQSMKKRCYNTNHRSYGRYGGRGIYIYNEWLDNENIFYEWCHSNGFKRGLQIDRRDNDGSYTPENCRFVTRAENIRNSSRCSLSHDDVACIKLNLETSPVSQNQLATLFGVHPSTISNIKRGKTWAK